jgi:hypothetical protein
MSLDVAEQALKWTGGVMFLSIGLADSDDGVNPWVAKLSWFSFLGILFWLNPKETTSAAVFGGWAFYIFVGVGWLVGTLKRVLAERE